MILRIAAFRPSWASEITRRTPPSPRVFERAQERRPERLVFGVADVDAEHLTVALGGHPGRDHDRPATRPGRGRRRGRGHRSRRGRRTGTRCGRACGCGTRRRVRRARHRSVTPRTWRSRCRRPSLDQVIDRAGRHAGHVGLHHHRVQRLVDPPTRLEDRREEASPCAASGSPSSSRRPWSTTSRAGARCVPSPAPRRVHNGRRRSPRWLRTSINSWSPRYGRARGPDRRRSPIAERVEKFGQGRLRQSHRCVLLGGSCRNTPRITPTTASGRFVRCVVSWRSRGRGSTTGTVEARASVSCRIVGG